MVNLVCVPVTLTDSVSFLSVLPRGYSTTTLNKSFFYRCHIFWNFISLEIREIRDAFSFKAKLKQYLWKLIWDDIRTNDVTDNSLNEGIT